MSHSHNLSHVGNLSFFFFFHYLMPHRIPDCSTSMDSKINTFLGGLGKKKKIAGGKKEKCYCIPLDFSGSISKPEWPPPGARGALWAEHGLFTPLWQQWWGLNSKPENLMNHPLQDREINSVWQHSSSGSAEKFSVSIRTNNTHVVRVLNKQLR